MNKSRKIVAGHSSAADARAAVAECESQVRQPETALVLFFCSSTYDLAVVTEAINQRFVGVPVVGCTTAGEIGPAGYLGHSLSGMSFPAGSCSAVAGGIDGLQSFEIAGGRTFAQDLLRRLEALAPRADARNSFGLLLIDGLSMREEPVTHALQDGLGGIRMIGGSAGDDLKFERTWVFHDGAFHSDSAALVLVSTDFPFRILKSQHFVSDGERMVVTEVAAARRVVKEINGLPAVEEYGRIVGVPAEQLMPSHFAAWPVVVMIDGTDFVRSIQHANPDGSLTFYCAIDEGVVLRVAHGKDLLGRLEATIDELREDLGELFRRNNAVGFATYGEQYGGAHVNQTMTGIAIGSKGATHD